MLHINVEKVSYVDRWTNFLGEILVFPMSTTYMLTFYKFSLSNGEIFHKFL